MQGIVFDLEEGFAFGEHNRSLPIFDLDDRVCVQFDPGTVRQLHELVAADRRRNRLHLAFRRVEQAGRGSDGNDRKHRDSAD